MLNMKQISQRSYNNERTINLFNLNVYQVTLNKRPVSSIFVNKVTVVNLTTIYILIKIIVFQSF